jgi:hypothetical protein
MRPARAALVLALAGAACSRAQPGPRPLPPEWVEAGGGPGPALGRTVPPFEAAGHDGVRRTLDSLRGPNGLLLNFNRSVVW